MCYDVLLYIAATTFFTTSYMRKWVRENVKASDKRKVAKERYEARKRAAEEETRNEQE